MKILNVILLCFFAVSIYAQQPTADLQSDGDVIEVQYLNNTGWSASGNPELFALQAGDEVEGDFHISPQFEPQSANGFCWVAHRNTNNISVVDVFNSTLERIIPTDMLPVDIAFSTQYGLVACLGSRTVQVFDLSTYTLVETFPFQGQPLNVEVSKDGSTAIVALDDTDQVVALNLSDLSIINTFDNIPNGLASFSFITSNTRGLFAPSGMALSPDGSLFASGSGGDLLICETESGTCTAITEVQNALKVRFTEDGNSVVCISYGNDGVVSRVSTIANVLESQLIAPERLGWANGSLSMNADGSRVLVPGPNKAFYFRMDMGDVVEITTGSAVFWTASTDDLNTAVAGGFNTYLVDMNTGDFKGNTGGISTNTGAISPDGQLMLAMDPMRRERAELYITTDRAIIPSDPIMLGSELEGDATYSVTFTPDGNRVLAVNSLSGTVSVIDVATQELEKIIPLSWYEVYHIAVSPDSKTAIIGERLNDQVSIIDLNTLEVTHEVLTRGDRPDQTYYHPSGGKAYVLNAGGTDNISVIDMTLNPPRTIKNIISGNMGISWINYGIRTNLAISPDGRRGVLATPFDDEIQILDFENDEILESIQTVGFPLHTVLSDEIDGKIFAAVTLRNDGRLWIAEDIGGSVLPYGGVDVGGAPTQLDYNPSQQTFSVISNEDRTLNVVNPVDFEVVEKKSYPSHLTPIAVKYSALGNEYVLLRSSDGMLPHEVWLDGQRLPLPNIPSQYMEVSPNGEWLAIPGLHSDEVYLISTNATSAEDIHVIKSQNVCQFYPNPAKDYLYVKAESDFSWNTNLFQILDQQGRIIDKHPAADQIQVGHIDPGVYIIQVLHGNRVIQSSRFIKK